MVLFDGPHTYPLIASYAFFVGTLFGTGLMLTLFWSEHFELGVYIAMLGLFHELEYLQTAWFNPTRLTLDSFLLNHSNEYHMAVTAGLIEYALELYFLPFLKTFSFLKIIGLMFVLSGAFLRAAAMYTARESFNHHVQSQKANDHVLVTHGVYSLSRHPAYAGFFWYALGTQILLSNPLCIVAYIYALYMFFVDRIRYAT